MTYAHPDGRTVSVSIRRDRHLESPFIVRVGDDEQRWRTSMNALRFYNAARRALEADGFTEAR